MHLLPERTLDLFEEISCRADDTIRTVAFSACADLCNDRAVRMGKKLLDQLSGDSSDKVVLINSAIHMLMTFGEVALAERHFSRITEHDAYTFGVMMNGYNMNEAPHKCLTLFQQLKQKSIACNDAIHISLISACAQIGIRSICRRTVDQIHLPANSNPMLKNCLIDMWASTAYFRDLLDPSLSLNRVKPVLSMKPKRFSNRSLNLMLSRMAR